MTLEQQFSKIAAIDNGLTLYEVSQQCTKITRELSLSFSIFCAENYVYYPLHKTWLNNLYIDGKTYTTEALLKIYEDEVFGK